MVTHRIRLLFVAMFVLSTLVPALAQSSARWEGIVTRSNKQKSTFTVRARASTSFDEKLIHYDSSTQFTYQGHGDKTPKDIDPSQIKDGDRVICVGFYNDKKEFQAVLISKRISN
jgi:hypothetical protein